MPSDDPATEKSKVTKHSSSVREIVRKTIGGRIRTRRLELGLTQAGLAEKVGVTHDAISHFEAGRAGVDSGDLVLYCQAMEVPVIYFYQDWQSAGAGVETEIAPYYMALDGHDKRTVQTLVQSLYQRRADREPRADWPQPVAQLRTRRKILDPMRRKRGEGEPTSLNTRNPDHVEEGQ
jgi:transcriptional regulator with XRE-family HTH domain